VKWGTTLGNEFTDLKIKPVKIQLINEDIYESNRIVTVNTVFKVYEFILLPVSRTDMIHGIVFIKNTAGSADFCKFI